MVKRPIILFFVLLLAGMYTYKMGVKGIIGLIVSVFILELIFLFCIKDKGIINNFLISKRCYKKMTIVLLLLPIVSILGFARQATFENSVIDKRKAYLDLYERKEEQAWVYGTVKSVERSENGKIKVHLGKCSVAASISDSPIRCGDCFVIFEKGKNMYKTEVKAGNGLKVYGSFFIYTKAGNPGQFSSYEYYLGKDVYASINAIKYEVTDKKVFFFNYCCDELKVYIKEGLEELLSEEEASIMTAITIGEKDLLSEETKELFKRSGMSHVLAISGTHISIICFGFYRLLKKIKINIYANTILTAELLIFYVVFTGCNISALRAGICGLIMLASIILRRKYDVISALFVAAMIIICRNPASLYNASFYLSFAAVLGIYIGSEISEKMGLSKKRFTRSMFCSFFISFFMLPLNMLFFYEIYPYGVFCNVIMLPIMAVLPVLGLLVGVFGRFFVLLSCVPASLIHIILKAYRLLCEITGKLPFSVVLTGSISKTCVVTFYLLIMFGYVIFMYPWHMENGVVENKRRNNVVLSLFCLIAFLCIALRGKRPNEVYFLDVGQGDSTICILNDTTLMFDCGSTSESKVASYRTVAFLKYKGVASIDKVFVSHMDADHINGIEEILKAMPDVSGAYNGNIRIYEIVFSYSEEPQKEYKKIFELAVQKGVKVTYIKKGDVVYQDGCFKIECMWPKEPGGTENKNSQVFLLSNAEYELYLMGDSEYTAENSILNENMTGAWKIDRKTGTKKKKVCVLKAGHHGSGTSSSEKFIDAIQPKYAVFSCGYANKYGHPNVEVVDRIKRNNGKYYVTYESGMITLSQDGRLTAYLQKATIK